MISPKDILNDIKSRPPLQRDSVSNAYKNTYYEWELSLGQTYEKGDNLEVWAYYKNAHCIPHIIFLVSLLKYPEFNILNEGTPLFIKGKIEKIESGGHIIHMYNVSVKFNDNNKKEGVNSGNNYYLNSKVHYGTGDIVEESKTVLIEKNPWLKNLFGKIFLGLIIGFLLYYFGWN